MVRLIFCILYYLVCLCCLLALRKRVWYDKAARRGYKIILFNALSLPLYIWLASLIITSPIEEHITLPSMEPIRALLVFFKIFFIYGFLAPFWLGEMGGVFFLLSPFFISKREVKGLKFEEACKQVSGSPRGWARFWFTTKLGLITFITLTFLILATWLFR